MKKLLLVLVIAGVGLAVAHFKFDVFKPAAAKAYLAHRKTVGSETSKSTFSERYWLQARKTTIDACTVEEGWASVEATEVSYWMPLNTASLNFATIVTEKLYGELENQGGTWAVTYEEVTSETISTYEDRKK